ncbi:50S ribosomal protein L34e [Candidatus Woesearchaeota archaeon]|nr:MAG: 50S ribosomal protein L34e [Candidatus Woesearchaeota archaeon]
MPQGQLKSKTFKKKQVRTPGGRLATHYRKPKPKQAACSACGRVLHGIPRLRPKDARNTPKTKKRPERPYGGVLCAACSRTEMIAKARAQQA